MYSLRDGFLWRKGVCSEASSSQVNVLIPPQIYVPDMRPVFFLGSQMGSVVGILVSGFLLQSYKGQWEIVFYVFGGIGVAWFLIWTILCYGDPESHPFISEIEENYLKQNLVQSNKVNHWWNFVLL